MKYYKKLQKDNDITIEISKSTFYRLIKKDGMKVIYNQYCPSSQRWSCVYDDLPF